MEIILALNKIFEKYKNNIDDCYNQLRHEGEKEIFVQDEMKEYLDSLGLKNKIKVEHAYQIIIDLDKYINYLYQYNYEKITVEQYNLYVLPIYVYNANIK